MAGACPAATPIGMAPQPTTGTMAIKNVIASFPNTLSPKIMYVHPAPIFGASFLFCGSFLMNRRRPVLPMKPV
ncbi:MAG: hypothetical protein ACLUPV_05210 [Bilophila wadsworthia]